VSVAGGLEKSFGRGVELGCEAIQIFVKSQHRWQAKPLEEAPARAFREASAASPIGFVVAHASYLINLASEDEELLAKSRHALADELDRCQALGLDGLVLHPGAHLGAGEEAGVGRVARSLDAVLAARDAGGPRVLLENTAGQGTVLGYRFEQLAGMIALADCAPMLGVCIDSCHAFAAGYPLHEEGGLREMLEQFEATVGLSKLVCFHLNDSQQPFASRKDRHANLGEGEMGAEAFARLMVEPCLREVPMILETPTGEDNAGYRKDLELLRSFC
jgi:deoxyribonuclease-4